MVEMSSPPPMAWRYCGNQIKLWRTRAGITREELGKEAGYAEETIKSVEQGRRRPSLSLLQVTDDMCGAGGMLLAGHPYLKPEKFPARTREFMAAEESAIKVFAYQLALIPGLLQIEDYARVLMRESCPPMDDETVEERVAGRMKRQDKLKRTPLARFGFVIYEAALRANVGGPEVMKRQLRRLREVGQLRNVTVQVLPVNCGTVLGLGGPVVLLETVDHEHYAYVEGPETSALYSGPETISQLAQRHDVIRTQALNVADSAHYIDTVEESL